MSTTYKEKYREPFAPVVPGVEFVRFNDVADLRAKFSSEVCAILVEAIQGEGGVRPLTQEFFAEARALASSTGALLIVDEIQAGMGRTGKWCAYQHYGIQPDVTTLAKPLAGGLPLGRGLCTEEVARAMHAGMHGTTFGGGPLACAVAIAVIDTIEKEGLLAHATEVGDYFRKVALARQASMSDCRCARQGPDGCRRARFRGSGQAHCGGDAEAPHSDQLHQRHGVALPAAVHSGAQPRGYGDRGAGRNLYRTCRARSAPAAGGQNMASRATMERKETAVPVEKDPDILAAAARMAGEDLCSIADLSSAEVRAILKLGTTSSAIRASTAMPSTPSRWC
jgi:hypothetical protein